MNTILVILLALTIMSLMMDIPWNRIIRPSFERREIELNYRLALEHLDQLHREKMALMETLDARQLEERLAELEEVEEKEEQKVRDYREKGGGTR